MENAWKKKKTCKKNCMDAHVLWYTEVLVLSLQERYLKERMFLSAKNTDAGCEIQTEKSGFASIRWSVVVSKRLPVCSREMSGFSSQSVASAEPLFNRLLASLI